MTSRPARKKRKLSKAQAKVFLASPKGQAWLQKQIDERRARQRDPGPPPPGPPTKFPFRATINGVEVTVWEDWIEREESDAGVPRVR